MTDCTFGKPSLAVCFYAAVGLYFVLLPSEMKDEQLLELIYQARHKDQKAQTRLINIFWVDVFSFVMKKVQDKNDADEITVSVFSKVLAKLDLYDPNFQFKTWILTIAQNTVIDFWRRRKRENMDSSESLESIRDQYASSPEELLISQEDQDQIQTMIESLDHHYQDIIRLRFFEEKSIKEIAAEQNLTVANTKVRIMRAKKLLSALLKTNEFDD